MHSNRSRLANFVIGGTEKAGTTSVFDYLSAHPDVGASSRKETDFFRAEFSGDLTADARRYATYFERCDPRSPVLMEASPGYLGEAAAAAPRIASLVPDAKMLFILRDPIDRLYSSYHFHRGRLNLPQQLSFQDYVRCCLDFDLGKRSAKEIGLDEWYLKVLQFGCYSESLEIFRSHLRPGHIKVMFFDRLKQDERAFMVDLSEFLGIDTGFWPDFHFRRSNVTFSGRHEAMHRLAIKTNSVAEPLLRRYPGVKRSLVRAYKALNQDREGYDPMPASVRQLLVEYYRPDIDALQRQADVDLPDSWRYMSSETSAA